MLGPFLTLTAARGVRAVLALASTALLARATGADGLGRWVMVVAASTLLHSALLNWTQVILIRFGVEERRTTGRLDATYAMRWPLLAAGFAVTATLLWWQPFDWLVQVYGLSGPLPWLVAAYVTAIWLLTELNSLMQVDGRYRPIAFVAPLTEFVTVCFLAAALTLFHLKVTDVLLGLALIAVTVPAVAAVLEFRRLDFTQGRLSIAAAAVGAQFAWPLLPNFLIGYVSDWSDHLVLRYFYSDREVGVFQGAYQILLLLLSVSTPIVTVVLPRLIGISVTDPTIGRRYVRDVVPTLMILWLPVAAFCTALAPFLALVIYGGRFAGSAPIVAVLCIALPGSVLTALYGMLYTLQGRLHRPTVYLACMAAINVALSLALVPRIGPLGAAVGTAVSYVVSQWLYIRDQHLYLEVPAKTVGILFAASIAFSLLEGFALNGVVARLAVALTFTAAIIAMARHLEIVDRGILARLFIDRFSRVAILLTRVLVPQTAR